MATYNLRRFAHADGLKAIACEHKSQSLAGNGLIERKERPWTYARSTSESRSRRSNGRESRSHRRSSRWWAARSATSEARGASCLRRSRDLGAGPRNRASGMTLCGGGSLDRSSKELTGGIWRRFSPALQKRLTSTANNCKL